MPTALRDISREYGEDYYSYQSILLGQMEGCVTGLEGYDTSHIDVQEMLANIHERTGAMLLEKCDVNQA